MALRTPWNAATGGHWPQFPCKVPPSTTNNTSCVAPFSADILVLEPGGALALWSGNQRLCTMSPTTLRPVAANKHEDGAVLALAATAPDRTGRVSGVTIVTADGQRLVVEPPIL